MKCEATKWAASRQNQQNDMRPAKTQISLGIRPVWSVFTLRSKDSQDPRFLHADSEDSDQTGRMPRLICVFAGHIGYFVGFAAAQMFSWFLEQICHSLA